MCIRDRRLAGSLFQRDGFRRHFQHFPHRCAQQSAPQQELAPAQRPRKARVAMGEMLEVAPESVALEERPGQAPLLLSPVDGAHFSISHSGHWVACALSGTTRLGLDIELCDPRRDVLALARQAFGADVAAELESMPPEARMAAFYQRWSEAEARYKLGMDAGACVTLAHAEISIVLCSAALLAQAPALIVQGLVPD